MRRKTALTLCISALSTTGPLIDLVAPDSIDLVSVGGWTKALLCFAMILGRFEILVVLVILMPTNENSAPLGVGVLLQLKKGHVLKDI